MDVRSIKPCSCSADVAAISTVKRCPSSVTVGLVAAVGEAAQAGHASIAMKRGAPSRENVRIGIALGAPKPQCSAALHANASKPESITVSLSARVTQSVVGAVSGLQKLFRRLLTVLKTWLQWAAHVTKCPRRETAR